MSSPSNSIENSISTLQTFIKIDPTELNHEQLVTMMREVQRVAGQLLPVFISGKNVLIAVASTVEEQAI